MSSHSNRQVSAFIVALSLLASCNVPIDEGNISTIAAPVGIAPAPAADIDTYARNFLNALQPASIAESREYCGFFVTTKDGLVRGTAPRAGTADSCVAGFIPENAVASYHTHGGYLREYLNEVPSIDDALSAVDAALDDYVSTPGGRLWRVDGVTGTAEVLCGRGCLIDDPTYRPDPRNAGRNRYTLQELRALQG